MKTFLTAVLCLSAIFSFAQSQRDLPPNAEPGKCYAKCLMANEFDNYEFELPVYTGDPENDTVPRKVEKITLAQGKKEWVKKKADRKCLSPNPDDCLVWCLVEVPEMSVEREIVTDLSMTDFYIMETFEKKELKKKGGFTEWKEILCANKITSYTIRQIQTALLDEGFLNSIPRKKRLNAETKGALKSYQLKHGLPVGNLDLKTLDALGIHY